MNQPQISASWRVQLHDQTQAIYQARCAAAATKPAQASTSEFSDKDTFKPAAFGCNRSLDRVAVHPQSKLPTRVGSGSSVTS